MAPRYRPGTIDPQEIGHVLAYEHERKDYGTGDLEALRRDLVDQESSSLVTSPAAAAELCVDVKGRTAAGLRLSSWALYQVCRICCNGLHSLVLDLLAHGGGLMDGTSMAVELYNKLIGMRFHERISHYRMLLDQRLGVIEGLVSPAHQYLPNLQIYDRMALLAQNRSAIFLEASIAGRWLLLRYYLKPSLVEFAGERYYSGLHLSNHEVGQARVRRGQLVLRERDRLAALSPVGVGNQVRHVGRDFVRRLERLFDTKDHRQHWPTGDEWSGYLKRLQQRKLGLGQPSERGERRRRDLLVARLARRVGLPSQARKILQEAQTMPAHALKSTPAVALLQQDLADLTVLDVAMAMSRIARQQPVQARERLEIAVHHLMTEPEELERWQAPF